MSHRAPFAPRQRWRELERASPSGAWAMNTGRKDAFVAPAPRPEVARLFTGGAVSAVPRCAERRPRSWLAGPDRARRSARVRQQRSDLDPVALRKTDPS